jgi:hypothetical protein
MRLERPVLAASDVRASKAGCLDLCRVLPEAERRFWAFPAVSSRLAERQVAPTADTRHLPKRDFRTTEIGPVLDWRVSVDHARQPGARSINCVSQEDPVSDGLNRFLTFRVQTSLHAN